MLISPINSVIDQKKYAQSKKKKFKNILNGFQRKKELSNKYDIDVDVDDIIDHNVLLVYLNVEQEDRVIPSKNGVYVNTLHDDVEQHNGEGNDNNVKACVECQNTYRRNSRRNTQVAPYLQFDKKVKILV